MRHLIEHEPYDPTTFGKFATIPAACDEAYGYPFIGLPNANFGDASFDPTQAPNGGGGFSKDLSGNKLPNTPPFTLPAGAQYSIPISEAWAGTFHGDFYWQGNSFARIFNDKPYDQLHGYTNLNFALIFTNQDGWQAMLYAKNVLDTAAINGAFLNSDDTALTTNVFLTDPRLFGIRITKKLVKLLGSPGGGEIRRLSWQWNRKLRLSCRRGERINPTSRLVHRGSDYRRCPFLF